MELKFTHAEIFDHQSVSLCLSDFTTRLGFTLPSNNFQTSIYTSTVVLILVDQQANCFGEIGVVLLFCQ